MMSTTPLTNILFLDIETVPAYPSFDDMPDRMKELWEHKSSFFRREDESAGEIYPRAGIYAEFGKIVCISSGYIQEESGVKMLKIKSFFGDDEKQLLENFKIALDVMSKRNGNLCAHNGKEFDFPYMARRMLIHGIPLPDILNIAGKKPWEVSLIDTMDLWKFGDYKHYTSLDLLSYVFNIPSPKDDIDGSQVGQVYWTEKNLQRIVSYCEKDVVTLTRIYLKFRGEGLIKDEHIQVQGD